MFTNRIRQSLIALLFAAATSLFIFAQATAATVLERGHYDILDIAYEDGELALHIHDEANDEEVEPGDVVLAVRGNARTTVPSGSQYSFLGSAGAPVWILPQVQDSQLLWPGIATHEIPTGVFQSNSVKVELVGVNGPGSFSLYTVSGLGQPTVLTGSGAGQPRFFNVAAGVHQHANWAFSAPGRYLVTFAATATIANTGESVESHGETYVFEVAAGTPAAAPAASAPAASAASPAATAAPAPATSSAPVAAPTSPVAPRPPAAGDGGLLSQPEPSRDGFPAMIIVLFLTYATASVLRSRRPF
jgi:surface-anchored protein